MFYLIDPVVATTAIGARCGDAPGETDQGLLNILGLLTPRVEDAMNVASLVYGQTTDSFSITRALVNSRSASGSPIELRLSNGYVDRSAEIVVTGPNGAVSDTDYSVEMRYGIVTLKKYDKGEYTITYSAGFKVPQVDPENPDAVRIMENVPDWIKGVVTTLLIQWFRTMNLGVKVPEDKVYEQVIAPLYRELSLRVMNRYQRPRALVEFTIDSVRTDNMLV